MIITKVFYTIVRIIQNKQTRWFPLEVQMIKTIWTIAPAVILVFIAIPSLWLLYLINEIHNPVLTLKAVGQQWHCSYEYSEFTKLEFDSYMVQEEDLQANILWLLDTDNWDVLPITSPTQIIITWADILHSWRVPKLGVKIDDTPGCLNQVRFSINWPTSNLIWTMIRNLWSKPQMHTNHNWKSTSKPIYWVSKIRQSSDDWKQVMVT
jgi:cytochrome c oxidase subunit 2